MDFELVLAAVLFDVWGIYGGRLRVAGRRAGARDDETAMVDADVEAL